MSSDTKADIKTEMKTEECGTQVNVAKVNDNAAAAETPTLSFKDWKTLKDRENNAKEKSKPTKTNKKSNKPIKASGLGKNDGGFNRGHSMQRPQNFFAGNNFGNIGNCGITPLKPPPSFNFMVSPNNFNDFPNMNFNGNNNFNNFNGGRNMNNNFNNNNNFNDCNNFPNGFNNNNFNDRHNFPNGYNNNNFNGRNNFSNGFNNNHNFNGRSNFPNNNLNDYNNFPNNFNNNNNFIGPNLPDSFFATDGIYRQKDLMQRPLSPSENPFRDDCKANELLHKLQNKEFEKPLKNNRTRDRLKASGNGGNKTQRGNKQDGAKNSNSFKAKAAPPSQNVTKLNTAPKIFVPNPRATEAGVVPYLPKPRLPNDHPDMTVEERKKAWKDYREEMKPFRNRDFYNAKRTVQRLSKKDPKELDEKEVVRLAAAKEVMKNHKERLAAKYANYIKAEEAATGLGELYLLKKPTPTKDWNKEPPRLNIHEKKFQNYGNFGESQQNFSSVPGRKIVGGYSAFKGFVSGGMLEGNAQQGY